MEWATQLRNGARILRPEVSELVRALGYCHLSLAVCA